MNIINGVKSEMAPAAIGPYSAAVQAGDLVFVSGQLPIVPETGKLVEGSIALMTQQCLKNINELLKAAESGMDCVVKTTIFLTDLACFADVNKEYATFFGDVPPSRSCVQVAALPKGAQIEIEAIAIRR